MSKIINGPVSFSPEVENRAWKQAERRIQKGGLEIKMKSVPGEENARCEFRSLTPQESWDLGAGTNKKGTRGGQ